MNPEIKRCLDYFESLKHPVNTQKTARYLLRAIQIAERLQDQVDTLRELRKHDDAIIRDRDQLRESVRVLTHARDVASEDFTSPKSTSELSVDNPLESCYHQQAATQAGAEGDYAKWRKRHPESAKTPTHQPTLDK